ncbi:MAG: hypothetical protein Q8M95_06690 [Candidatus Methanoperedens sp.]|nr:hypothetical protein [Candidatus Methanoperedens sp.]
MRRFAFDVVVSQRSAETRDATIADISVEDRGGTGEGRTVCGDLS